MKRVAEVLSALIILVMFLSSPAAAANAQGFSWAVSSGNHVYYQFTADVLSSSFSMDERTYLLMPSPGALPSWINFWSDIPYIAADMRFDNGTSVGLLLLFFVGLLNFGGRFVVPIGNWDWLSRLAERIPEGHPNTTFIDNSAYWGMKLALVSSGMMNTLEASYLKSDGVMARYSHVVTDIASSTKEYEVSLVRESLPNDIIVMLQDNIFYIGFGVILLVVAVVCRKTK
jgi:hypothetical protein